MLSIKQCCHSPSKTPKFSAEIDDWVLVVQERSVFKGKILAFPSDQTTALLLHTEEKLVVENKTIVAVMLDD